MEAHDALRAPRKKKDMIPHVLASEKLGISADHVKRHPGHATGGAQRLPDAKFHDRSTPAGSLHVEKVERKANPKRHKISNTRASRGLGGGKPWPPFCERLCIASSSAKKAAAMMPRLSY